MSLKSLFFAFALVATAVFAADVTEEEDVMVLTDDNFDAVIAENELILVEFYAPWCGHCKNLAPHYAKAAATLKKADPAVPLAKVDATENRGLGDRFGVKGFPTLKWIRNGKASEYEGGRTESDIVAWVTKKSGPVAKVVDTAADADAFSADAEVAVFGIFASEESAEYKAYMSAAGGIDDVVFAVTTKPDDLATKFGVTAPALVLVKKFDELRNDLTADITADSITTFVNGNKLPLVIEFSQEVAPKIFGGDITIHQLVFVDKTADHYEGTLAALKDAAEVHKGKMLSVIVPHTESRVMGFFGLEASDLPAAMLVDMGGEGQMKKYRLEGAEVTADALKTQGEKFFAGDLKPFLKSAEVPEEPLDGHVRVLVGKNFEEVALDEEKDVLVEFYAPWCGHCKSLAPKYEALAEEFKDVSSVIIAKVDATENEVDIKGVNVKGFPTLYFFPAKGGAAKLFDGGREQEDMSKYIIENAKIPFSLNGEKSEDAKDEL